MMCPFVHEWGCVALTQSITLSTYTHTHAHTHTRNGPTQTNVARPATAPVHHDSMTETHEQGRSPPPRYFFLSPIEPGGSWGSHGLHDPCLARPIPQCNSPTTKYYPRTAHDSVRPSGWAIIGSLLVFSSHKLAWLALRPHHSLMTP